MSDIDFLAIANGIAGRFAPANITPPTGLKNITFASATDGLDTISNFPAVVIYPPQPGDSELTTDSSGVKGQHDFTGRFYLGRSSGKYAQDFTALYKWWGVLIRQFFGSIDTNSKLGLAPVVDKTLVTSGGVTIHEIAGVEYPVIELTIRVWTTSSATYTRT
jgi:hypothetical protein